MASVNFPTGLSFVWRKGYDSPTDGYHVTPGDSGGGTWGGVIEATWEGCVKQGLVVGLLRNATQDQLATVLREEFWGPACDALPSGVDFMLFNGRMMSGHYPYIFQECLGFIGDDLDGDIGTETLAAAQSVNPATFINALTGSHYAYLKTLSSFHEFGGRLLPDKSYNGWTGRLVAAKSTALGMIKI